MDETLALPSEKAVTIALRTQQILACETGVANTIDPLGGSYFIEDLTNKMEAEAERYFERIDSLGGVIPAIEQGVFQREIAHAAYQYQQELDRKEKIIVGVNQYVQENEKISIPILEIPKEVEIKQRKRVKEVKAERSGLEAETSMSELRKAAEDGLNLMPHLIKASRSYVTLGEMCAILKEVFGVYEEPLVF
jgi:methylmalonyl-CoA mutase N-terminal domain/subunit